MSMVYEMLYFPLYFFGFFGVDAVGSFVRKRCSRDEVDAVQCLVVEVVPELARRGRHHEIPAKEKTTLE